MLPVSGQSAAKMTFFRIAGLMLVLAAILLSPSVSSASVANVYVAQNGAGSANGADCADALPLTWVNNSSNWGSGANQVGPGSTVHLCGTFTGAAGGQAIVINGSGASGNPITIKFETGAVFTAPYWSIFGAISTNGKSWIVVDGGTNGIVQNTDNGSAGLFGNSAGSRPINVSGPATNVIVTNLTVANTCQHSSSADTVGCQSFGNGDAAIWIQGGVTNVTITRNTIHDAGVGIVYLASAGDSAVMFSNNTISRTNWGLNLSTIGASSGATVTRNDISCVIGATCNWDSGAANAFHHNGIMIDPQNSGDQMSNLVISNNFIHDINTCTAGIFIDPAAGDTPGIQIYNNVFSTTAGQIGPSDGWITVGIGTSNAVVLNNTIIGPGAIGMNGGGSGFSGPMIKNNIVATTNSAIVLDPGFAGVASDYNDFYNITSGNPMVAEPAFYSSVAAWVGGTGFDVHSITANPNLTASFVPNAGSPVIGKGVNLTSVGITGLNVGAPQTFGVTGSCGTGCVPRPPSGPWDMGAYQTSGVAGGNQPNPATALTAQGH